MERNYPKATITEKGERALRGGHPWVYADEVTEVSGEYENGGLADVFSRKGRYLGTGYINDNSKIRIRVISRNANDKFDRDFYARRIRYALDYRRTVMGAEDFRCCRLIFGEADSFPGFTVDRFGDILGCAGAVPRHGARKGRALRAACADPRGYGRAYLRDIRAQRR